jgi:hypothetical protein
MFPDSLTRGSAESIMEQNGSSCRIHWTKDLRAVLLFAALLAASVQAFLPGRRLLPIWSVRNLRQSRRLDFVNRSKRYASYEPLKVALYLNIVSWSIRWSSCSCFLVYSRICFSSRPTVET